VNEEATVHCGAVAPKERKKERKKESSVLSIVLRTVKGKAVPLQAWSGPEVSRKLRFPDLLKTAQYGGKVASLTHLPHLPPGNTPGTHFCYRLSRPHGHSAAGRFMSTEKSNDTIWA
jgi:hypothetical protein